jgi:uncharacterized membrane protein YqjE
MAISLSILQKPGVGLAAPVHGGLRMEEVIPPKEQIQNSNMNVNDTRSLGSVVREVTMSLRDVITSEVRLAKAEIKESSTHMVSHLVQILVFSGLALLGVLAFLSFCVIGLGELLNNNYWLSSLIVAAVFTCVGGGLAYRAYRKMKTMDLTFPETRRTLGEEVETVQRNVREISDVTKRRAA